MKPPLKHYYCYKYYHIRNIKKQFFLPNDNNMCGFVANLKKSLATFGFSFKSAISQILNFMKNISDV